MYCKLPDCRRLQRCRRCEAPGMLYVPIVYFKCPVTKQMWCSVNAYMDLNPAEGDGPLLPVPLFSPPLPCLDIFHSNTAIFCNTNLWNQGMVPSKCKGWVQQGVEKRLYLAVQCYNCGSNAHFCRIMCMMICMPSGSKRPAEILK